MGMWPYLFVLLSVSIGGVQPNIQKWLMNKGHFTQFEVLVVRCGLTSLCALIAYFLFQGYWEGLNASHANPRLWILALVATTIANIGVFYYQLNAQKIAEVSFLAPLSGMTPGVVAIAGILFGEIPGITGRIGIATIAVATYIHAREGCSFKEYLTPFYVWRAFGNLNHLPELEQHKRLALRYAYLGSLCSTVGLTSDGLMARSGNAMQGLGLQFGTLTLIFLAWHVVKVGGPVRALRAFAGKVTTEANWKKLLWLGILAGSSPILLASAYVYLPVAYVGALKRLSIVVGIFIALFFFNELKGRQNRWIRCRRLSLGACVVLGAILITLDPTKATYGAGLAGLLMRN